MVQVARDGTISSSTVITGLTSGIASPEIWLPSESWHCKDFDLHRKAQFPARFLEQFGQPLFRFSQTQLKPDHKKMATEGMQKVVLNGDEPEFEVSSEFPEFRET
eukprot:GILJ01020054.1.p1 GENE.GILJ01020054.1~~GILJ01020054.1.p1  ORF type:complete len:105 (+),score=4.87 GILJ01020054.1:776-1090(+)